MKRISRKCRLLSGTMLAIALLWQTAAILHLIVQQHVVCEHGKVMEARELEAANCHHECDNQPSDGDSKHDSDHHDGCDFLAALTHARTMVVSTGAMVAAAAATPDETPKPNIQATSPQQDIIFIAPSHSPPMARTVS